MSKLIVNDLEMHQALDRQAMAEIKGGVMARYVIRNGRLVLLGCTDPPRPGDRTAEPGVGAFPGPRL